MNDSFEASALRSLVDQLSAQVTQLSMQMTMMQNNRNDAWVNNIPTHFTPIPMANGGGGMGLHPYKLRYRKKTNEPVELDIYFPPRILSIRDKWMDDSNIWNIHALDDVDCWYRVADFTEGFSGYVTLEFSYDFNANTNDVTVSIYCRESLSDFDELKYDNREQIVIGEIRDGKIKQYLSSPLVLKPIAEWCDPIF